MGLFNRNMFGVAEAVSGVTRCLLAAAVGALLSADIGAAPLVPEDQELLGQFYSRSSDGYLHIADDLTGRKLQLFLRAQQVIIEGETSQLANVDRLTKDIESNSQPITGDVVAAKYIAAAKARGSTVSLYRPVLTAKANAILPQANDIERRSKSSILLSADNMLIEFAADRTIRSFLTKIHKISVGAFAASHGHHNAYINIYVGGQMSSKLENSLTNTDFKEAYIRDL